MLFKMLSHDRQEQQKGAYYSSCQYQQKRLFQTRFEKRFNKMVTVFAPVTDRKTVDSQLLQNTTILKQS